MGKMYNFYIKDSLSQTLFFKSILTGLLHHSAKSMLLTLPVFDEPQHMALSLSTPTPLHDIFSEQYIVLQSLCCVSPDVVKEALTAAMYHILIWHTHTTLLASV